MQSKNRISITRKTLYVIMLLGVFLSTFGAANLPTAQARKATTGASTSSYTDIPIYNVSFVAPDAELIPADARDAIIIALNAWPDSPPDNNTFYLIDLSWNTSWAIATLTSANLESQNQEENESPIGLGNLISLLLVKQETSWQAAIDVDPKLPNILALVPEGELSQAARSAIFPSVDKIRKPLYLSTLQVYNNYKFPWPSNQAWRLTNGWHDTYTWGGLFPANTSLDFDIVGGEGSNSDIKAAAPGILTYRCTTTVDDQALVYITTDGTSEKLGYLHLSKASLRFGSGAHVNQGDVIGTMANMDNGSGGGTTPPSGSCASQVSMRTHVHIYFPSKPFIMDGITFSDSSLPWGQDLFSSQSSGGSDCNSISGTGIKLFDGTNCTGSEKYISQTGFTNLPDFNDKASSIYVSSGWSVKVYQDNDKNGSSRCINGNMWDLAVDYYTSGDTGRVINNDISSVDVFNNSTCSAGPPVPDRSVQFYKDASYQQGYCYGDSVGAYGNLDGCSGYDENISSVWLWCINREAGTIRLSVLNS